MIYNEDCLEGMKRIPDGSVDMIATDPPYFSGMTSSGYQRRLVLERADAPKIRDLIIAAVAVNVSPNFIHESQLLAF